MQRYTVMGKLENGETYDMEIEEEDIKGAIDEYERMVEEGGRKLSHIEGASLSEPVEA